VIPNLRGSGCEKVVAAMLPTLNKHYKVGLITYDSESKYQICDEIDWQVIDSPNTAVASLWSKGCRMLVRVFSVSIAMKIFSPDVILSFIDTCNIVTWVASKLAKIDCPVVAAEHTIGEQFFKSNLHANRNEFLLKFLLSFTYNRVSSIIAISQSMAQYIKEDLNVSSSVDIVYNGFDESIYYAPFSFMRADLNLVQWPRILTVGALNHNKNQKLIISIFPQIKKHFPRAILTLVGEGELYGELKSQAERSSHSMDIFFAGWSDCVPDFYRESELLVQTSHYEGLPNVILEGFMCGLPAVCTPATSAYAEAFFEPYCGQIISSWNADELVEAMFRVLNNYSNEPSFRAQLAINSAKRFSLEHMIAGYETVLNEAISSSGRERSKNS
jgi:glycosyltransferase involved in cell wall biosynthesis